MTYFSSFPTITWNNFEMVDISRRAVVLKKLRGNPYLFAPYVCGEDDTIENIAQYYYGDPKLSWMVALANNIVDPYSDFFKNQTKLKLFIAQKYRAEAITHYQNSNITDDNVIAWTQNTTITDNIIHYYSQYNKEVQITKETFAKYPNGEFLPMRAYDYEQEENESKRTIQLIDVQFVGQIENEMKALLNG